MLVLSRFIDESIRIDLSSLIPLMHASPETLASILAEPIDVLVVDVRSDGKARLGIEANRNIAVHRSEVFAAIQRNKQTTVPRVIEGN
jgi:carbon storage regulator CsrA